MTLTTPVSGVRAFAPMNFLGAPRVVYSPGEEDGGAPTELSLDEAAARFTASQAPEVPTDDTEGDEDPAELTTDDTAEGDELEDVDGETGDEDQAEDDDENELETEQGRFVADNAKVRLEDGTVVSIGDLKKGSLLHADYTRKTQEAAELRRSAEAQSSAIQQQEQQLSQQRDQMVQLLQSIVPQAPDPSLATTDPYAYTRQKAEHEAWVTHLNSLEQQSQKAMQEKAAESEKAKQERGSREWATLIEKMPGLKDQNRFKAFVNDVRDHGTSYGFTEAELAEAVGYDHRQALVIRDAIAWRKLQASKPKVQSKVEGRPPVQRSGKRLSPDENRARSTGVAMERLKKTGTVDDAAAAFLAATRKG
jgi:hypothetical protein